MCSKGLKNEFETTVVNEPSVLKPLNFYCIFDSYSESQFLREPDENVHAAVRRKKYQINYVFVSFYLHMKFSTLKGYCAVFQHALIILELTGIVLT